MDRVAAAPSKERRRIFLEAAEAMPELSATIIEKDFWVCWALKEIFSGPPAPGGLIFKGGTSLSKAYRLIERFSEDVDLSFDRVDFGFLGDRDPEEALTSRRRRALLDGLQSACVSGIRDVFMPSLTGKFTEILGKSEKTEGGWDIAIDGDDPQTVLFRYPQGLSSRDVARVSFIRPMIRLEIGARSDSWPSGNRMIKAYAVEAVPASFQETGVTVRTLEAERTFWEKATLLHAEFHRPESQPGSERVVRHYYDLFKMMGSPEGMRAVKRLDLLQRVAAHKKIFFRSAWAHYETAKPGTLRLVPIGLRESVLRKDYEQMREMIFGPVPSWNDILGGLFKLENLVNGG